MKWSSLKRLWRIWPGFLGFAIVFFALAVGLQPRPRSEVLLAVANNWFGSIRFSSHCRYLAQLRFWVDLRPPEGAPPPGDIQKGHLEKEAEEVPAELQLFDLTTGHRLFSLSGKISEFGFDEQDDLLYVESREDQPTKKIIKQLFRCHAFNRDPILIARFELPNAQKDRDNQVPGPLELHHIGSGSWDYFMLSPHGNTWLICRCDDKSMSLDLIDTRTGLSRGLLELPKISLDKPDPHWLELDYSGDEKVLLLQSTSEKLPSRQLRWFSTDTGKLLTSCSLSEDEYLTWSCLAISPGFIAVQNNLGPGCRVYSKDKKKCEHIACEEVKPHIGKDLDSKGRRLGEKPWADYRYEPTSDTIVYTWDYFTYPTKGAVADPQDRPPGFFFSVRSARSGDLLHTDCLLFHEEKGKNYYGEWCTLREVLPGPVLALSRAPLESNPNFIEKWVDKIREWAKLPDSLNGYLHLIDGRTGKELHTLKLTYEPDELTQLSADRATLILQQKQENKEIYHLYDYPLHKPWLLILSWSIGVALAITMLVESKRWWKRRRA